MAAGMTELLKNLPKNHPERKRIMAGYTKMMTFLKENQGRDGMWKQFVDQSD